MRIIWLYTYFHFGLAEILVGNAIVVANWQLVFVHNDANVSVEVDDGYHGQHEGDHKHEHGVQMSKWDVIVVEQAPVLDALHIALVLVGHWPDHGGEEDWWGNQRREDPDWQYHLFGVTRLGQKNRLLPSYNHVVPRTRIARLNRDQVATLGEWAQVRTTPSAVSPKSLSRRTNLKPIISSILLVK